MVTIKNDGDIFTEYNYDALICTTNTVGVMGKGIALEFKKRFPNFYKDYKDHCNWSQQRPGTCDIYSNIDNWVTNEGPRYLITFMTKDHWRYPSKIEWITSGLKDLIRIIREHNNRSERVIRHYPSYKRIESIALPALGCSNGGLSWPEVRVEILKELDNDEVHKHIPLITVYAPREWNEDAINKTI